MHLACHAAEANAAGHTSKNDGKVCGALMKEYERSCETCEFAAEPVTPKSDVGRLAKQKAWQWPNQEGPIAE